jgi:acetamidase/formamidase
MPMYGVKRRQTTERSVGRGAYHPSVAGGDDDSEAQAQGNQAPQPTLAVPAAVQAAVASGAAVHTLPATPETCFWGFLDRDRPPVLQVASGDVIYVETLTHQAGDAPDLLMDAGTHAVYEAITPDQRGPGVHIMTGPVFVEGAEVGDTLEVHILRMAPRLRYGTNIAAWWGYLYRDFNKERITVYEIDVAQHVARAAFAFDYVTTPLYTQPGVIIPAQAVEREHVMRDVMIPLRPHLGVMGVAPAESGVINSIPPGPFGGNIDNWRIGPGATMYYPVLHPGALFFAGDPHMAEGDGELSGTALEASANVWVRLVLRKDFPVTAPILETDTHWYTHGFSSNAAPAGGPSTAPDVVFPPPGDLNEAMREAANQMLRFLCDRRGLSPDEAYSLMSLAADFGVTQVVDVRQGVHCGLPKAVFGTWSSA